ncbi:hypothetical protein P3X46_034971 [Hevea brasiliensis]|uniref:RNase H type-1 domain-containing protein n=1 Tax=Hevea brasiliensis TaxID=3981 RepID=A0ABQ9K715_HEVBR|nr:hypothetical protein P3X46_034971 [Hevea brasiliensis]
MRYFYIISIRDLLSQKWDIRLRHIFRENNMCADWMAHFGGSIPIGLQLFDDPPLGILSLLFLHICGISYPRLCLM